MGSSREEPRGMKLRCSRAAREAVKRGVLPLSEDLFWIRPRCSVAERRLCGRGVRLMGNSRLLPPMECYHSRYWCPDRSLPSWNQRLGALILSSATPRGSKAFDRQTRPHHRWGLFIDTTPHPVRFNAFIMFATTTGSGQPAGAIAPCRLRYNFTL